MLFVGEVARRVLGGFRNVPRASAVVSPRREPVGRPARGKYGKSRRMCCGLEKAAGAAVVVRVNA